MAKDLCFFIILLLFLTITAAANYLCNSRDEAAFLNIKIFILRSGPGKSKRRLPLVAQLQLRPLGTHLVTQTPTRCPACIS